MISESLIFQNFAKDLRGVPLYLLMWREVMKGGNDAIQEIFEVCW